MTLNPTSGPSGGGSGSGLPSQWTAGASGNVVARVDNVNRTPLAVRGIAAQNASVFQALALDSTGVDVGSNGAGGAGAIDIGNSNGADVALFANGDVSLQAQAILSLNSPVVIVRGPNAAPADAALAAGWFALWLDQTPGATKLMVKAKDSGGTVRTAAVPLA